MVAVIFDCDGVLVDSEPLYAQAFAATLAYYGCPLPANFLGQALQGKSLPDCYRWLAEHLEFTVTPGFEALLLEHSAALTATQLQPVAGIVAVVKALVCPKAVASNGQRASVLANLRACHLLADFGGHIYTADVVPKPKPAPDVYLYAALGLGVAPQQCLVVEDSVLGVTAALAAGMQVCWLTHAVATPSPHANVTVALSVERVAQWLAGHGVLSMDHAIC